MFHLPSAQEVFVQQIAKVATEKIKEINPQEVIAVLLGAVQADVAQLKIDADGDGVTEFDECAVDLEIAKDAVIRVGDRLKAAHERAAAKK